MALNAQILLSIVAHEASSGDLSRTLRATPATYAVSLADGTGASQAQVVWSGSRTATTANDDLSLSALSDTRDGAAVTVAFTQVKAVYVKNTSSTATLRIGGVSGATAFEGLPVGTFMPLPPGGCYLFSAPSASGAAANTARFASASGSCTYDIVIIGEGSVS
jgi:hypothetical protein